MTAEKTSTIICKTVYVTYAIQFFVPPYLYLPFHVTWKMRRLTNNDTIDLYDEIFKASYTDRTA